MTTYADIGPYVPEPTFEAWLAKQGFPETYVSIFDWEKEELQQDYERVFDIWDEAEHNHEKLSNEFEKQHNARLEYMRVNGIEQWSDLDSISQKKHIEKKEFFLATISEINQERKRLKDEASNARRLLPLLAGVLEETYQNYEKICTDERATHGLGVPTRYPTEKDEAFWDLIGPLRNNKWNIERKPRGNSK